MRISRRRLRRIIKESLPPWMIDAIRRREEQAERASEAGRRLPLHPPPPLEVPPDFEEEEEEDPRGPAIIDYRLKKEEKKMKITRRQLRRIIREATRQDDWAAKEKEIHDFDEDPYDDLLTALQGTFLGSPPREMDAAALVKVGEYYPDEAKELMAMSNNKLNNIIAMAWPTGY